MSNSRREFLTRIGLSTLLLAALPLGLYGCGTQPRNREDEDQDEDENGYGGGGGGGDY